MNKLTIPAALGLLGAGYSVIPTYYNKLVNPKVTRRVHGERCIALTFDDGPDPRYTGALLDLLKEQQVHATFFVVAKKADQHPELIDRMLAEGHEVALHSYEHGNGLLKGYRYTKLDFAKCAAVMRRHGWPVRYFRPPWGHSNLFTAHFAKQHDWKLATWSVMAQDWKETATPQIIAQKLLKRVHSGSVVCLHDSGGAEGAPARTIHALRHVLPIWKAQGYRFIGLE